MINNQPFKLINNNQYPILMSINFLNLATSLTFFYKMLWIMINILTTVSLIILWINNISMENLFKGSMNFFTYMNFKTMFIWVIISELMIFITLLWNMINNFNELNQEWMNQNMLLPYLNTIILVNSSIFLTYAHQSTINNKKKIFLMNLMITIISGLVFTLNQFYEFFSSKMNFNDPLMGHSFLMTVTFHWIHVILGSMFLIKTMINHKMLTKNFHLSLEISSWYWHFVDMIWLIVFFTSY